MAIIKSKNKIVKEQFRISITKNVIDEIRQYCEQFDIAKVDDFFEQAAQHILSKDKEWLAHIKHKQTIGTD